MRSSTPLSVYAHKDTERTSHVAADSRAEGTLIAHKTDDFACRPSCEAGEHASRGPVEFVVHARSDELELARTALASWSWTPGCRDHPRGETVDEPTNDNHDKIVTRGGKMWLVAFFTVAGVLLVIGVVGSIANG